MEIPYGELMKYHNNPEVAQIYDYPVYSDEFTPLLSILMPNTNILDLGCGNGKFYNQSILPMAYEGEYVGIDNDPTLKNVVNFKIFETVDEVVEAYPPRHFDVLMMYNFAEHVSLEEFYEMVIKLNPLVDANIAILTPNVKCLDYLHNDPQHKSFYPHDFLYGLLKHLDFQNIEIYRGGGYHMLREHHLRAHPEMTHLEEMNDYQRRVCLSMGLDWYGNILMIGERE